jgi:hypothetical protein
MLLFFLKKKDFFMTLQLHPFVFITGILSVAVFWYCMIYPYSATVLKQYACIVATEEKNAQRIGALEQQCTVCQDTTNKLQADYVSCIAANRSACSDDGMINRIINNLETHQLHIKQFQLQHKEKKEWHHRCCAALAFEGPLSTIVTFFKLSALQKNSFIPQDLTITFGDNDHSEVAVIITWLRCHLAHQKLCAFQ